MRQRTARHRRRGLRRDAGARQHRADRRRLLPAPGSRKSSRRTSPTRSSTRSSCGASTSTSRARCSSTVIAGSLLPRRVREAVARFMGVDKVMTDSTGIAAPTRSGPRTASRASRPRQRPEPRAARCGVSSRSDESDRPHRAVSSSARSMGRIYDATWGRGFSALYDRGSKGTEEAGLREMRRKLLAEASGRTIDIGSGTGANLGLYPGRGHRARPRRARPSHDARGCGRGCANRIRPPRSSRRRPKSCRSRTRASTPRSTRWSSARCPIRRPPWPRRRGSSRPGGKLLFVEHVRSEEPGRRALAGPPRKARGASSATAATATATPWPTIEASPFGAGARRAEPDAEGPAAGQAAGAGKRRACRSDPQARSNAR